jgi:hypothetical protein
MGMRPVGGPGFALSSGGPGTVKIAIETERGLLVASPLGWV